MIAYHKYAAMTDHCERCGKPAYTDGLVTVPGTGERIGFENCSCYDHEPTLPWLAKDSPSHLYRGDVRKFELGDIIPSSGRSTWPGVYITSYLAYAKMFGKFTYEVEPVGQLYEDPHRPFDGNDFSYLTYQARVVGVL